MSEVFFSRRALVDSSAKYIFRGCPIGTDAELSPIAKACSNDDMRKKHHSALHGDTISFLGYVKDPNEVNVVIARLSQYYWRLLDLGLTTFEEPYQ